MHLENSIIKYKFYWIIGFFIFTQPAYADVSSENSSLPSTSSIKNTGGRNQTSLPSSYKQTRLVEMCLIPLPTPVPVLGSAFQHVFLRSPEDDQTFGMPMTRSRSYFGGESVIESPDPFYGFFKRKRTCAGVYIPQNMDEEKFYQRFKCITEKLVDKNGKNKSSWRGVLDYHWQENNCHSGVRFMLDCAGGVMSMSANGGLGSDYDPNKKASIEVLEYSVNKSFELYPQNVEDYINQLEQRVSEAYLSNQTNIAEAYWQENRKNIEQLLQSHISELLSSISPNRKQLIENYKASYEQTSEGILETYDKFVKRFKFWQESTNRNPDFIASSFVEIRNFIGPNRSIKVVDKIETDYKGICEQARKECF